MDELSDVPESANAVSVDYATFDGTAAAGSDYLERQGTLVFAPGATNQTLRIPILGDLCNEPDETFFLQLSAPTNVLLLSNESTGRVLNDDPLPLLRVLSLTTSGNGWRIQFSSGCGQNYRLLRSDTLALGSWMTVADPIAGTGAAASVIDTIAPSASQAFYRIELLP